MKTGQRVKIINKTPSGADFIEGTATLVRKVSETPDGERWIVKFLDGEKAERLIPKENGDGQNATGNTREP